MKHRYYFLSAFLGLVVTTLAVATISSAQPLSADFEPGQRLGKANLTQEQQSRFEERKVQTQGIRDALDQAFANRDYNAWKEIVSSQPRIADYVNEENFEKFAQMHELKQSGNFEEARDMAEELDLPMGMGVGHGFGQRGHMMKNNSGCPYQDNNQS